MKRAGFLVGLLALLGALVGAATATAAGLQLSAAASGRFPARAYLLTLPTKLSLTAAQVAATENGAPVQNLSVLPASAVGESNFGTVLIIDTSASMHGTTIDAAMGAARSFARYRNPQQPVGVITFSSTPAVTLPLTTDAGAIKRNLAGTPPLSDGTKMFDAVSVGLQMLAQGHVKAGSLIVLSDGADTGSHIGEQAVASAALAQHVRVYTIGVRDRAYVGSTLRSLAAAAGGSYTAVTSHNLTPLYRQLGAELSNQYLISYRSLAPLGSSVQLAVHVAGQPGAATTTYTTPAIPVASSLGRAPASHSFWRSTLAAVLVCIVCALLVGLAVMVLVRRRRTVGERVGAFVSTSHASNRRAWTTTLVERAFADERHGIERTKWWARLTEEVDLAGAGISPRNLVLLTALGTILLAWLLVVATGSPVAVLLAAIVPLGARLFLRSRVDRQRRAFDEQLPDNLQVVASAMRAGHTFVGALTVVAEDAPEPSRRELRRVLADEALGVPLVDALTGVTQRMRSQDFEHVALVAALQRETGGNTAEVIDTVTETIRDRIDLRRLVRTLTAQGRLAGRLVSALPIGLLLVVSLINPRYIHPLFHRAAGIVALCLAAVMLVAGSLIIRRIVDIEI